MKISQAENLFISLCIFLDKDKVTEEEHKIRGSIAYKLARNKRIMIEQMQEYHQLKNELFQKYGEEQNGRLVINTLSDNYLKYQSEIADIEDLDINLDLMMITDDELQNCKELTTEQQDFLMDNFMEN